MPATIITTLMVILVVTTASANQSLRRAKRQGEDQPPPNATTCPQFVLPGPPGPPGGLSYSEAKELKQDIKEELQESLTEWIKSQAKALKLSQCSPTLGKEPHTPAKSCRDITDCNPLAPSGMYWLQSPNIVKKVFCDLETHHCGTTGWVRLAYLNMTEPGASCPTSLRQINTPAKLCGRHTAPGCSGVTYSVDGIRYSKVCGQARGYQYYSPDAFKQVVNDITDINSYYVDGVSITYGMPRHHLWTYASGLSGNYNNGAYNCPCAKYPGESPPAFVGLDYYCESGITGRWQDNNRIALEDPLWDGHGCGPGNSCCAQAGMPWFCRTLPQGVSENIEVRVCADAVLADEEVYIELLEVYIQ